MLCTLFVWARYKRSKLQLLIELRRYATKLPIIGAIFCASRRDKFNFFDMAAEDSSSASAFRRRSMICVVHRYGEFAGGSTLCIV
jgi:hypothetical protein